MSSQPFDRERRGEAIAGFIAAVSIFASLFALDYRPVRIVPFALVLAFVAAGIGGRHSRLAAFAVFMGAACFVAGLVIAIVTRHPLF